MTLTQIIELETRYLLAIGVMLLAALALLIQGRAYRARGRRLTHLAQDLQESQRIARIGTVRWDFLRDRVEWTDEYARLLALPYGGHMTGGEFQSMLMPEYEDLVVESERVALATSAETGKPARREIVYKVRARDGRVIDVAAVSELMADREGRPLYLISTIRDVSEERRQQLKLSQSEQNLSAAMRVADLHWLRQEHPALTVTWSANMNRLLGRPDDAEPVLLRHFVHPEDFAKLEKMLEAKRDLATGRGTVNHVANLRLMRPDGAPLHVRAYLEAELDHNRELTNVRGVLRDITEELAQEAKLQEAVTTAERANQTKSEFLAVISHELRTPLNGVLGMLSALEDSQLDADQRGQVKVARSSANALLVILNDILDASKIEAGRLQIEEETFELNGLVRSVIHLYAQKAQEKGLHLDSQIDADIPPWIRADAGRIRQILSNLVSNAIKFTSEGSVILSVTRCNVATGDKLHLRLGVKDTGAGIPEEYHSRVFGRFEQLGASYSNRMAGTGLGLSISLSLAELMGGKMGFESEEEKGSYFWLDLPVTASEAQQESDQDHDLPDLPQMRILVAEDNSTNQLVIRSMLERMGQNVDMVVNGAEAVEAVSNLKYDLVLMDVSMPVKDGTAATREIRALPGAEGRLPIIGLTAHAGADQHSFYLESGFDEVLTKPVLIRQLAAALDRWKPATGKGAAAQAAPDVAEPISESATASASASEPAKTRTKAAKAPTPAAAPAAPPDERTTFVDAAAFAARLDKLNREFSGGLTAKMLAATRRDIERHLSTLTEQMTLSPEAANSEALRRAFHALVGIFSTLECETMTTQCRLLETLPDARSEATRLVEDLVEQLHALRDEIDRLMAEENESQPA
ncbi:ATP-binding protein [Oceanicola sp. S124]|uniref:ATP-binding protein n=1 Tax=Oceanicola sp. S124 TaxID=1042378 RepID=UPI0002557DC8|nr:ATP-binding protein [Oceanicola sp. S124]